MPPAHQLEVLRKESVEEQARGRGVGQGDFLNVLEILHDAKLHRRRDLEVGAVRTIEVGFCI